MPKRDERRQQLILEALAPKPDAGRAAVDQALWPWERLAEHLTPLIGDGGFCALYGRAVRLTAPEFKWITASQPAHSIESLFQTLREDFASVEAVPAGQANNLLLDTYTGLLSALIGEVLTTRLLNSAWNEESDGKNKQEISK
jgi:hypothetical protein